MDLAQTLCKVKSLDSKIIRHGDDGRVVVLWICAFCVSADHVVVTLLSPDKTIKSHDDRFFSFP
jgi:hypothetical protein